MCVCVCVCVCVCGKQSLGSVFFSLRESDIEQQKKNDF